MSHLLNVSSNPHIRDVGKTSNIMFDVVIALMPASLSGVFRFGYRAALIIFFTVLTCVLTEALYQSFMKKPITISDGSAIVTGLLLALNLPATLPYWIAIPGGAFAIIIVKQLFGGLGQNFMNPALAARCFLLISFTSQMTNFNMNALTGDAGSSTSLDALTSATPLQVLREGGKVNVIDMFVGNINGTIGETSVIAIGLGVIYLLVKKIIDLRIPFVYLTTFIVFLIVFGNRGWNPSYLMAQLSGGGLILGAFFMATDYVTSPITSMGHVLYGICLGLLTALFRIYGSSAEGVSYAIIFSNLLVPLIEKITMPKALVKEEKV